MGKVLCQCESELFDGTCLNPDCAVAQGEATKDAARETAKATTGAATITSRPRAWSSSGSVD